MSTAKPKGPALKKPVEDAAPQAVVPRPQPDTHPRVSMDAQVWQAIDQLLANLPYKTAAPIIHAIHQTGGVQPVKD
jgi:hypothetical protein